MLRTLEVGHSARLVWHVGAEQVIVLGEPSAAPPVAVFSTPAMINLMEHTARAALRPYLEPGEESVGTRVDVEHLAATPLGASVRATATVTAVAGRTVDFSIEAFDPSEQIGRGTHRRAVIDAGRFAARVAEKAPQTAGGYLISMRTAANDGDLPPLRTLLFERKGAIAKITLNRPERRNAVDRAMTEEWERLLAWLAGHPDVRVVIVTGAGSAFSAGDDVKEVGTLSLEAARELNLRQARMYLAFEELPQVFIAAVQGHALGAGCVCACACDFRIASHAAQFGMPEILLGWPPGYGLAQLTALVGRPRALELCLTATPIGAAQALDWGLVHELVPGARLQKAAHDLAERLLAMPPAALAATKQAIYAAEGVQPKIAHLGDTHGYIRCLDTADAREGIAAFLEKRKPRFPGK